MILVDTSAWVEFDRAAGSEVDLALTDLIASGADIAVTEPVLMEVLAGARDEVRLDQLSRLMTSFDRIPVEVATDFEGAADVYRCAGRPASPREASSTAWWPRSPSAVGPRFSPSTGSSKR